MEYAQPVRAVTVESAIAARICASLEVKGARNSAVLKDDAQGFWILMRISVSQTAIHSRLLLHAMADCYN